MHDDNDDNNRTDEEKLNDSRIAANGGDEKRKIDAGKRSPRWFERIEQTAEENRNRSTTNQKLLERLDTRTVWIARLILGILITVIGGVILQTLI